ncbi:ribose 5-phosphate isomerase B [Salidesulfovibrio brasiliensis]|uniref:ribose 5-phosphate isomerase B n=1 Tax=Salidesulfovibrio brasiliensis TaxID=221711 RepID=UPI0006CF3848|nr:ribose 5-phosphate isomerase B [Salidesulfovibrio brasiliensis]
MSKTIVIGSDHGGFNLKQTLIDTLEGWGYTVKDEGPHSPESCDYPVFAAKVVKSVREEGTLGVLVCGSGQGMAMTANRFSGIRAALCTNEFHARMGRAHNNANVLCMGERVTGVGLATDILKVFLETEFEGDRHKRRVDLIDSIEK